MNNPSKKTSKLYLNVKTLPLNEEKNLCRGLWKVSNMRRLLKKRLIMSSFKPIDELVHHHSEKQKNISNFQVLDYLRNVSISERHLNDSMSLDNSQSISLTLFSSTTIESTLEKAKKRVLKEDKYAIRSNLFFEENKLFLTLMFGEASEKEIDTIIYYLKNRQKNYDVIEGELNNTYEQIKNPVSNLNLNRMAFKSLNLNLKRDLNKNDITLSSLNDSYMILNTNHFKDKKKDLKCLELDNCKTKILNCDFPCCRVSKNFNKSLNRSVYFNEKNKKTQSLSKWKVKYPYMNDDQGLSKNSFIYYGSFTEEPTEVIILLIKPIRNIRSIKSRKYEVTSKGGDMNIRNPFHIAEKIKASKHNHEDLLEHIREKNKFHNNQANDKELVRGGRVKFKENAEGKMEKSELKNIPIPMSEKLLFSVRYIQRSWKIFYFLRYFLALKIQSVYRGYILRNKISHISYAYFQLKSRLGNCNKIMNRYLILKAIERIKEYKICLEKMRYIRCNVLMKRSFYKSYEKDFKRRKFFSSQKKKRIFRKKSATIEAIEEVILETVCEVEESYILTSINSARKSIDNNEKEGNDSNFFNDYIRITDHDEEKDVIKILKKLSFNAIFMSKKIKMAVSNLITLQRRIRKFLKSDKSKYKIIKIKDQFPLPVQIYKSIKTLFIDNLARKIQRLKSKNFIKNNVLNRVFITKIFKIRNVFVYIFIDLYRKLLMLQVKKLLRIEKKNITQIKINTLKISKFSLTTKILNRCKYIQRFWKRNHNFKDKKILKIKNFQQIVIFNKFHRLNHVKILKIQKLFIKKLITTKWRILKIKPLLNKISFRKQNFSKLFHLKIRKIIRNVRKYLSRKKQDSEKCSLKNIISPYCIVKQVKNNNFIEKLKFLQNFILKKKNKINISKNLPKDFQFLKRLFYSKCIKNYKNMFLILHKWKFISKQLSLIDKSIKIQRNWKKNNKLSLRIKTAKIIINVITRHVKNSLRLIERHSIEKLISACKVIRSIKKYKLKKRKKFIIFIRKNLCSKRLLRILLRKWKETIIQIDLHKAILHLNTFHFLDDFSNKLSTDYRTNLIYILNFLASTKQNQKKVKNFIFTLQKSSLYRTIHLFSRSSVFKSKLEHFFRSIIKKHSTNLTHFFLFLWKKQSKQQLIQEDYLKNFSQINLRNLFIKRIASYIAVILANSGKRLRMIDLIYTMDYFYVRNVKRSVLKQIINIWEKNKKFENIKSLFKELYMEMKLSYLKTIEEYNKLETMYRCEESGSSSMYGFSISSSNKEEKMKFKYGKLNKKFRTRESENWWLDYDIKPSVQSDSISNS